MHNCQKSLNELFNMIESPLSAGVAHFVPAKKNNCLKKPDKRLIALFSSFIYAFRRQEFFILVLA
jgi:hypothetical protein